MAAGNVSVNDVAVLNFIDGILLQPDYWFTRKHWFYGGLIFCWCLLFADCCGQYETLWGLTDSENCLKFNQFKQ